MAKPIDELYKMLRDQSRDLEKERRAKVHAQGLVFSMMFPTPANDPDELEKARAMAIDAQRKHADALRALATAQDELRRCIQAKISMEKARDSVLTRRENFDEEPHHGPKCRTEIDAI